MNNVEIISDNLSKSFSGRTIFKNLSFEISSRQSLSITGKNGSGKTTLIRIIANLIKSSSGKILFKESNSVLPDECRFMKIGFVSPYINLYDELTGFENLEFFYKLKSGITENSSERINHFLEKVNLHEYGNADVKNYSSGMKQRLKIAFAILNEPEILLMDEPRTNLDRNGIELLQEICARQKENGILIIATNEESDRELCDRILNIEDYS